MRDMADDKLIGQNYTTPDLVAKVTGKAKYAEDYRVEGMLFAKLLVSPMPHARVKRLDTSAALAMPGVKAILTVDDMPGAAVGATLGENVRATAQAERGLTNEPLYYGEPVPAVAAGGGAAGAGAAAGGAGTAAGAPAPGARGGRGGAGGGAGAAPSPPQIAVWKWTDEDFANAKDGQMPMGKATDEWVFGNIEEGFKKADL